MYAGEVGAGERAVAPFRALAEPIADMLGPKRYPEIFEPGGDEEFHPVASARTMYVDTIDRSAAETIVEQLQASTAMMAVAQLRVLGGAAARVPADATAYAHRQSRIMVNVAAFVRKPGRGVAARAVGRRASRTRSARTTPARTSTSSATRARSGSAPRTRATTWDRLVEIKRRYDPTNLFRLNQNIPPARGRAEAVADQSGIA